MTEDTGLDLVGVGKLAKAIPQKAWIQIVDTACKTFSAALAPFTALTSGVGRLIEAKFDRLVDAEKVLAAGTMVRAQEKVSKSKRKPIGNAKASVVLAAIESSATETDVVLRELWSNLLAQEIMDGKVHPEFPKILSRLSSHDAQILARIAVREKDKSIALRRAIKKFIAGISILGLGIELSGPDEEGGFTYEHLANLHLIRSQEGIWALTLTGKAFIQSVSDSWDGDTAV